MFTRIVVPLDGSELAEAVLGTAEQFARLAGATLHLVRVVTTVNPEQYGALVALDAAGYVEAVARDEQEGTAYLARMLQREEEQGFTVTSEIRQGDAAQEIVASCRPGDVIVMATHGRGGLHRLLLGSVASAILQRATVPVLLIRVLQPESSQTENSGSQAGYEPW